jgi:diacylglycerol kinase (ATP)
MTGMQQPPANDPLPEAPTPGRARGLRRIWQAGGYSLAGLHAGWHEASFRAELLAAVALLPLSLWLGTNWVETALLAGSVLLVMTVELINTALETAIDRIGPQWHPLSKRAKDLGSAAVLLSLLLAAGIWLAALYQRFIA